jgi:hypothetical protein
VSKLPIFVKVLGATIASQEPPPRRSIAGAVATAEKVAADLKVQIDAFGDLSTPRSHSMSTNNGKEDPST